MRSLRARSASLPHGNSRRGVRGLQPSAEFDPVFLGPLLAVLGGRMQRNCVGRGHGVGNRVAIEAVVDRTLRHVTERKRCQRKIARDGVLGARGTP